jgi:hypothetical protein
MWGYPVFKVPIEAPGPTCGYPIFRVPIEAPEPTTGSQPLPWWGQFFGAPLVYLIFLLGGRRSAYHQRENIDGRPREVPELKVQKRPPST